MDFMDDKNLKEIAFFGRITAGITHELKNVLAVIKETSGLMGDILDMKDGQGFQHKEKFQKAISTIQRQIENGVTLLTHLNKFAHAPDRETDDIDLHAIIKDMSVLCGRYARLKSITLGVQPPDQLIKFTTCQVSLQMAIFSCLDYCISNLPQQSQIDISLHHSEKSSGWCIDFNCSQDLLEVNDPTVEDRCFNTLEKLGKAANLINASILKDLKKITLAVPSST